MAQQRQSGNDGEKGSSNLDTATAGASLGTLLELLVLNLSDVHWFKSWLMILAPAIAVGASSLAAWGKREYRRHNRQKELDTSLELAEDFLASIIKSKRSTPDEKAYATAKLETLKRQRMDRIIDKVARLIDEEREDDL